MRSMAPALPIALLLSPAALAAQITVGPGVGFDFPQITDALVAAAPGDTILVAAGTYDGFTVTQPVSILGTGSSEVIVVRTQAGTGLRVTGIPAGQTARISGMEVERADFFAGVNPFIEVDGCAGTVILSDLLVSNIGSFLAGEAGHASVEIADSSQVLIDNSRFVGWPSPPGAALLNGVSGLHGSSSNLFLSDVTLTGGFGGAQFKNGGLGAPALDLDGCIVTAARLHAVGGGGGAFFGFDPLLSYSFPGAAGIDLTGSTLTLHGGPGNLARGGYGGSTSDIEWSSGGAGVRVDPDSFLRLAADAVVEAGDNGDGSPGPLPVQVLAGGTVQAEPFNLPTIDGDARATLGSSYALDISGSAGGVAVALLSFDPIAVVGLATVDGSILIDPAKVVALTPVALDGAGSGGTSLAVPADPVLTGLGFTFQSVEFGAVIPRLSNATTAVALP